MNKEDCARIMQELPKGRLICEMHRSDYSGIFLQVLAADVIGKPLYNLLRKNGNCELIERYCDVIEQMWREGDQEVIQVLEMTILEHLSEDAAVWEYISDAFRSYVNEEVMEGNIMMSGVEKLEGSGSGNRETKDFYQNTGGERELW